MFNIPYAFFITFPTYGSWVHGNSKSSVHHSQNQYTGPLLPPNPNLECQIINTMKEKPYIMSHVQREAVLESIKETCQFKSWELIAAHVRSNHIHLLVRANAKPNNIMNTLKAYASRKLKQHCVGYKRTKFWARHGSTRYIWRIEYISGALNYLVYQQGKMMSVYVDREYEGVLMGEMHQNRDR